MRAQERCLSIGLEIARRSFTKLYHIQPAAADLARSCADTPGFHEPAQDFVNPPARTVLASSRRIFGAFREALE
ncbi:hypothetical protein [Bosea rubneri]|uniref:Uncharacterized protein n=1 Tax=Bosea rubneri TaxID=3075434 RepID=A0ABU3SD25_9HYPH|nr:hypothetical protein [Bosea sp. ZW T0_25]MDU0342691.1 hypothetical protein [Bosea sp. ZW T0_25]